MTETPGDAYRALRGARSMDHDDPSMLGMRMPVHELLDLRCYTCAVRSNFTPDRYNAYPLPGRTLSLTVEPQVD